MKKSVSCDRLCKLKVSEAKLLDFLLFGNISGLGILLHSLEQSPLHIEAASLLSDYTHIELEWQYAEASIQVYIKGLLENDLPALYQLLYKIDVDEKKARQAFGSDTDTIAKNLTGLIMQRVLQKAESRLKYKS